MDPITGLVIASGEECNGEFIVAEKVLGKTVKNLCGSTKTIVALCDDAETPYVDIFSPSEPKIDLKFSTVCGGQYHMVALSGSQIYSWGDEAVYGELGLAALSTCVSPMLIPTKFDVSAISSGDFHSAVVDSNGNIFTWGQNFKKQLGLYCKPTRLPSGTMVESLMMTPRIVPFSLNKMSVRQVACGSTFTVAISKAGDVWAWGSGECGQLGGGRCTVQEVPKLTVNRISESEPFVTVACGFAHTLALTSKGDLYSWGLNHNGQLGIGDNKARHLQTLIPALTDISKIYASVNSSACLSVTGNMMKYYFPPMVNL
jgi:alpha-tubulin suppressor-like RCC1 family protein